MTIGLDTIRARTSVRSYDGRALSPSDAESIAKAIAEEKLGPFGGKPRFVLLTKDETGFSSGKIGTYGVIKDAPAFIAGVIARAPFAMEDFGYCLEGIVLKATACGLGTCWLGGIFDRAAVTRIICAESDELVPACTPVGKAGEGRNLRERLIRRVAGSERRKPTAELFFTEGDGGLRLPLADHGSWAELLEAVRIGPSASNKQPWRLVVEGKAGAREAALHLYIDEDRLYNSMLGENKMQDIDAGIAMRHVDVAASALGLSGSWLREDTRREDTRREEDRSASSGQRYIASWRAR